MNYMKQVAEMLGVEIGEVFKIEDYGDMVFYFEENGLYNKDDGCFPLTMLNLLNGTSEIIKLPWKPKTGDIYYYYDNVDCVEIVDHLSWKDDSFDLTHWKAGNCFRTEEEAKAKGKELMEQIRKEYGEA